MGKRVLGWKADIKLTLVITLNNYMGPKKLIANILIVLTVITALFTIIIDKDDLWNKLFPNGEILNIYSVLFLIIVTNFFTFYTVYICYYREKDKRNMTQKELDRAEFLLADNKKKEVVDVYTGIPNEKKFRMDIENLGNRLYQLILIDLDNFGKINKKYGHDKGDKIMKLIAQSLYNSMRRDEEIYKREQEIQDSFVKRIYRKYNKGDEFIFLIKGEQFEAIGFINRVKKEFAKFSRQAEEIVGEKISLDFHAAISPIHPNESFDIYYRRLHECFVLAAEEKNEKRIYWYLDEHKKFDDNDFRLRLYQEADKLFRI
ncbi:diguanylate cyclase (GGDEF)-like protein [Algoriphagus sp. 4150]|uniref:diguanylate cyclase domain-containing protein n=1 Tax=Algoriphagus sp. 4150 TaxID=2817756 RepID=UPI002862716E|nr:diguanylate cyclase [Algoriphagus sp. 4150]MDR7128092.1 diguanylate cyclase (GGDEF)-like protein [Algoriphagus sp. 4150]